MDTQIIKFIKTNRVGVLSILRKDGGPHSATLHYAFSTNPLRFYFSTENTSRKCEALLTGEIVKGSMVIGFSEKEWLTLQLDGKVKGLLKPEDIIEAQKVFYASHPSSEKYKDDPATIFLEFTPSWWRYTDYNTKPVTILSSEK